MQQLRAIELLLDGELCDQDIAKEIGVHRRTLCRWCSDPDFAAELDRQRAVCTARSMKLRVRGEIVGLRELIRAATNPNARDSDRIKAAAELANGRPKAMLDRQQDNGGQQKRPDFSDVTTPELEKWIDHLRKLES